jgi:hypothetical protein
MTKVIGCMNCGYRSENKAEMDLFIANGCKCQQADTHCDDCDNGTDTPCTACLWDGSTK